MKQAIFWTTDGGGWRTKQDADEHQRWVDFKEWCDFHFIIDPESVPYSVAQIADEIWKFWNVTPLDVAEKTL